MIMIRFFGLSKGGLPLSDSCGETYITGVVAERTQEAGWTIFGWGPAADVMLVVDRDGLIRNWDRAYAEAIGKGTPHWDIRNVNAYHDWLNGHDVRKPAVVKAGRQQFESDFEKITEYEEGGFTRTYIEAHRPIASTADVWEAVKIACKGGT